MGEIGLCFVGEIVTTTGRMEGAISGMEGVRVRGLGSGSTIAIGIGGETWPGFSEMGLEGKGTGAIWDSLGSFVGSGSFYLGFSGIVVSAFGISMTAST